MSRSASTPRYDVLAETLEKLEEKGIYWRGLRESEQSAVARLKRALEITHVPESYQISIGLRAKNPQNLAAVVNCLAETFILKARAEEFYGEGSRVATLVT